MAEANVNAIKTVLKDGPTRTGVLKDFLEKKYGSFIELPYLLKSMEAEGMIKYDGNYWKLTTENTETTKTGDVM